MTRKELTGAAPKTTSAGILGGRPHYCHLPKVAVVNLIGLAPIET